MLEVFKFLSHFFGDGKPQRRFLTDLIEVRLRFEVLYFFVFLKQPLTCEVFRPRFRTFGWQSFKKIWGFVLLKSKIMEDRLPKSRIFGKQTSQKIKNHLFHTILVVQGNKHPIGSMGMVYWPTFGWFYDKCRANIPVPWILWDTLVKLDHKEKPGDFGCLLRPRRLQDHLVNDSSRTKTHVTDSRGTKNIRNLWNRCVYSKDTINNFKN